MGDLQKKRKVRGGHKAYATKELQTIETVMTGTSEEKETLLRDIKDNLNESLKKLTKLNDEILELLEEEKDIEQEIADGNKFRRDIRRGIERIVDFLKISSGNEGISDPMAPPIQSQQAQVNSPIVRARLPKLELKKFNGSVHHWQGFWDAFKNAVHENNQITEIDKFTYLKGLLEGEASTAIAGLSLTQGNYEAAIEILYKRFGDEQKIISAHMERLLKLTPVHNGRDTVKLRMLYDDIEVHIRGLQSMGIQSDSYGTLLVPVLLSKLPDEVKLEISRGVEDGKWKLDDLLKKLIDEITARERCTATPINPLTTLNHRRIEKPITSTFLAPERGGSRCAFCMGQHGHVDCRRVDNIYDRRQIVKKYGRCFVCLEKGHKASCCKSSVKCSCGARHHPALCEERRRSRYREDRAEKQVSKDVTVSNSQNPDSGSTLHVNSRAQVVLQTAQAIVSRSSLAKPEGLKIRVIFDAGSQRSYVTERVAKQLQLDNIGMEVVETGTFGEARARVTERELVKVHVGHLFEEGNVEVEAYKVPLICRAIQNQHVEEAKKVHPYLKKLWFSDVCPWQENLEVDMLIGADFLWDFMKDKVERGEKDEPVAVLTSLGWVLSGPLRVPTWRSPTDRNLVVTHVLEIQSQALQENEQASLSVEFQRLWDLDSLGIRERDSVHERFLKNVKFQDGRYVVSLPWKEHHKPLPLNYDNSAQRLRYQLRRLRKDPQLLREYDSVIQEQRRAGVIEVVNELEGAREAKTHYLPHHAVIRRDAKTTKLRVVYDASSRASQGKASLNDCLHVGPSLTPLLFDVLLRFRCNRVALIADIEKAFLNIEVDTKDRDCLRFLWIDDFQKEEPVTVVYRFCRVVFGVSSSPFLLSATLRHHLESYMQEDPEFVKRVLEEFYVDDLNSGADSVGEAFTLYQKIKYRLGEASFRLRKWSSNSEDLMKKISNDCLEEDLTSSQEETVQEDDYSYVKTTVGGLDQLDDEEHKVLGEVWNRIEDTIVFKFDTLVELGETLEPTKRNLLKITAKFFDPLGMLSPLMVGMKILFQECCQLKLEWDEPLSEAFQERWRKWVTSLKEVNSISVPRYILTGISEEVLSYEIHSFGDASDRAYCAMVYLVCVTGSGRYVNLMSAKTRLAPLTKQGTARLELMAGRITAQLTDTVKGALQSRMKINSTHLWLDNITALYWIKGEREWSQFVQNRVNEILRLTTREQWDHCPGIENPADIGSRGVPATKIKASRLWWQGPYWLRRPPEEWPTMEIVATEESEAEVKKSYRTNALLTVEKSQESLASLISMNAYSSCEKLFRVTAHVYRFVKNLKFRVDRERNLVTGGLKAAEVKRAEHSWVKEVQSSLTHEKNLRQLERDLGLYTDECGIIRCRGRIPETALESQAKHPALLPRGHHLSNLFIEQSHKRVHHGGVRETLTELRTRFWISRGRQAVKQWIRKCVVCKRYEGTSYPLPATAELPSFRTQKAPPFAKVGIDFAGPLYVKKDGPEMQKVYIALFSCAVTRAVHLDLTEDLGTGAFLRCFRRFLARRGVPQWIVSDNAKTFKSAAKELKVIYDHPQVQDFLTEKRITWRFNLEKAPWWGGFYERMVKSIKRCLRKTLGNARLTENELLTVITEVEGTLNVRPLTYVYEEGDPEEALTPAHLMFARRLTSLPPYPSVENGEDSPQGLNKRMRYLNLKLDHFWKRWKREYLTELREHHKRNLPRGGPVIKLQDVVTVSEEGVPRGKWRLGKVEDLLRGKDGEVRGAKVKVLTKKGRPIYLNRPVQQLYPLEVTGSQQVLPERVEQGQIPTRRVPRRVAAIDADTRRRCIDQLLSDQGGRM